MQEMQDRLNEAVTSLKQMTKERETWQAEERHLHNQLASARKAQTMAQSRLILTKQREAQLKVQENSSSLLYTMNAQTQMGNTTSKFQIELLSD